MGCGEKRTAGDPEFEVVFRGMNATKLLLQWKVPESAELKELHDVGVVEVPLESEDEALWLQAPISPAGATFKGRLGSG